MESVRIKQSKEARYQTVTLLKNLNDKLFMSVAESLDY